MKDEERYSSRTSIWVRNHNGKIIFVMLLVDWVITTWIWVSDNPKVNFSAFLFYFFFLLLIMLTAYIDHYLEKKEEMENNFEPLDPQIYDLSYSILMWVLARIINFIEFNDYSFGLIYLITFNLSLGIGYFGITRWDWDSLHSRITRRFIKQLIWNFNFVLIIILFGGRFYVIPTDFWFILIVYSIFSLSGLMKKYIVIPVLCAIILLLILFNAPGEFIIVFGVASILIVIICGTVYTAITLE